MMLLSILSDKKEADVTEISYIRSIWLRKCDAEVSATPASTLKILHFYGIDARVYYEKTIRLCITQGRTCLLVIRYSEIVQIFLKSILCRQTGITQIAALVLPLFQAAAVEHLDIVLNDKRRDVVPQTFFE